jgi:hypothetical protein
VLKNPAYPVNPTESIAKSAYPVNPTESIAEYAEESEERERIDPPTGKPAYRISINDD